MCEAVRRDPLDRLTTAVDEVAGYLAEAPTAALGAALAACRRQQDRLEAAFTKAAGRFAVNREYVAEGAPSAVSWLKANCRMSAGAAAERLNIARQMDQLPDTDEAFSSGQLGYQHAALIARLAGQVGTDTVREAEGDLLKMAADFDPNRFSLVTRRLRHCVDPMGPWPTPTGPTTSASSRSVPPLRASSSSRGSSIPRAGPCSRPRSTP